MSLDIQALRDWVSFAFLVIGGSIAIRTYVLNQRQRRLENSFRLINLCKDTLTTIDFSNWYSTRVASSEQAGAKPGFLIDNGKQIPLSELFGPNIIGQDSIERFCELFNLVCYEYLKGTVDFRLFYFEYGQYMSITYYWVSSVGNNAEFVKAHYPFFYEAFHRKAEEFQKLPYKTVSRLE